MKNKKYFVIAVAAVVAAGLAAGALLLRRTPQENSNSPAEERPGITDEEIEKINSSALTGKTAVLLIGLDAFQENKKDVGFMNNQQSDFVNILIFNHDEKTFTVIHLNRDTICDVTRYGLGNKKADTIRTQLALSHTYGDGGALSCENTVASVNSIFPEIEIEHYASVTMEAVVTVTDICGGIPVVIDDDYTSIDPRFEKGATLTLDGETALSFIRMRRNMADPTNTRRMERQKTFMYSLATAIIKRAAGNTEFVFDVAEAISPYLMTDADEYNLSDYFSWITEYEFTGIVSPEGHVDETGKYARFYPDKSSIKEITEEYWG